MSIDVKNGSGINTAGNYLASQIIGQLKSGKKVLWFVTGGSSVAPAAFASHIISNKPHTNLTVVLTDERYGEIGHADSNLQRLMDFGLSLPEARIIPVLQGKSREETTKDFNRILEEELNKAEYKIGLFGVGADGHTAGIMPNSEAVNIDQFAFGYKAGKFERITITFKTIVQLDEAVVFMQGEEKWGVLEDLVNKEIDLDYQPAQILKKIPLLIIFTDKNEHDK